jgi:hypothetical protein
MVGITINFNRSRNSPGAQGFFTPYTRRWVPHLLDVDPTKYCWLSAIELLELLREGEPFDFNGVTTGNGS